MLFICGIPTILDVHPTVRNDTSYPSQACAYIRENGDSSKGKRRKAIAKDRRKVGKKLSRRQLGEGGALEVRVSYIALLDLYYL